MSRVQLVAGVLEYIVTHVFYPLRLPDKDDHSIYNDRALALAVITAARLYSDHLGDAYIPHWNRVLRMLENLQASIQSEGLGRVQTMSQLRGMDEGDVLVLFIRAQNAAVIFRKQKDVTIYESFEVSPRAKDVMVTEGKIICSYPGPAIEVPSHVFGGQDFLSELVNFLVHMNRDNLNEKKVSTGYTAHPLYITELLTGILRSVGHPADVTRVSKRIGDYVGGRGQLPWRRSSLWLIIRVALHTTLNQSALGQDTYKEFMLFFMCCIANEQACGDFTSDLLQFMSSKISRRLRKLGSSSSGWVVRTALGTCTSIRSTIEARWLQIQTTHRRSPLWAPSQLDLIRDSKLLFRNSGEYLRKSLVHRDFYPPNTLFDPKHHPRGTLDDFLSSDGEFFERAYGTEPYVTLYDVEQAVEKGIDTWVDLVTDNDGACVKLEILACKYSSSALKIYANDPELFSIMFLTTIELWIALDKIAVKEIPMLADYSPEVPTTLLENLLLCKGDALHRLRLAYDYLSRRHTRSRRGLSVFSPQTTADSFSVRFFKTSSHQQHLMTQIERQAWGHVHPGAPKWHRNIFSRFGRRAKLLETKVVVFELDCPVSFNMWRTATFHLLVDICSPPLEPRNQCLRVQLDHHRALRRYLVKHPRSRISLGFNTIFQFGVLYYAFAPATAREAPFSSNLTPFGFDTMTGLPVSEALGRSDIRRQCTYKLQGKPYNNLQKYVDSTSHTSNEVIAGQTECHEKLSIHEYMAFGHLRCGSFLQWFNILRELRGRLLNFRRPEVYMLLAQTTAQVGPPADTAHGWVWHQDLQAPSFCHSLLEELRSLILDVEVNWQEGVTMHTVSFLLRRLLASSPNRAITMRALGLLCIVRDKAFTCVQRLSAQLVKSPEDDALRGILRDTAAICRSTFDLDPAVVPKVLHSAEDIKVFLASAILIHHHMPTDLSCISPYSQILLDRDRRLSLSLEHIVTDVIQADPSDQGIDLAVRSVWPDYRAGSKWLLLASPNSRWLSCTTAPLANQFPQTVHLNILDGSLLVNGKQFGTWLPNAFVRHPLYKLIFGEKTLKVLPSDIPGMDYSTQDMISGHQVHFSFRNNSDLVIRAKQQSVDGSEIMELIPHEKLKGDLLELFIEGHVHWLNLSTSIMEIRPLGTLWKTSPENWRVNCTTGHYRMWRGHESLVDNKSQTWAMVSSVLKPLAAPQDLIITVSPVDPSQIASSLQLSVVLPRYDLSFYVDEDGDLQSRNFREMVYDENQSIGTFFGLLNQLVLRPKIRGANGTELNSRCVLVPDGDISFHTQGHHVRVVITPPRLVRATYMTYSANTDLGCLTGNASLTSKLYCAYLHILTSGCGSDPLTGRSGTEEALSVLRSASCLSNVGFGSRDATLLSLIASACSSGKINQSLQMAWRNIPVNYELYALAKSIKERYERIQLLYEDRQSSSSSGFRASFPLRSDPLLNHGARRAMYLVPSELAEHWHHSEADVDIRYRARDIVDATSGEHCAFTAATYVYHRIAVNTMDIWSMMQSWQDTVHKDSAWSLQYSRSWLTPSISSRWLRIYDLLRKSGEKKWFQLLFSLPAMAFASPNLSKLVPVFVAFASHIPFRFEDPPHYNSYPMSFGCYPSRDALHDCVRRYAIPFERSPEYLQSVASRASFDDRGQCQQMYEERLHSDADATATMSLKSWPSETSPPCSLDSKLYHITNLENCVRRHISGCFHNLKLKEHVARIQVILSNLNTGSQAVPDALHSLAYTFHPPKSIPSSTIWPPTIYQLFLRPAPLLPAPEKIPVHATGAASASTSPSHFSPLHQLIAKVEKSAVNPFQRQYVSALHTSARCFRKGSSFSAHEAMRLPEMETLTKHYAVCRASYVQALCHIQEHLSPRNEAEEAVALSGQWPCITAYALFQCLASNSAVALPASWKKCLITFVLLVLELQRARRLLLLHFDNLHEEFFKELENEGCDGWDAAMYPDWLLIQLQSNFLIRRVQAEIAHEMLSPRSGHNTAMQLNMGEGKTSVIVPMVAAVLANGDQLVRVIVPKALTTQTLHVLSTQLGGLTNRRLYYLPFSRSQEVSCERVTSLRAITLECMRDCGILVLQPEHVLSLKLVSVEKQLSRVDSRLAGLLLSYQKWLESYSRDVVDEIDDILDVRSQLVFTIGGQQSMQGFPERWTTTEQVLSLVGKHALSLRELYPLGVEYEPGPPGSFPHFRVLQADAGQQLVSRIVRDATNNLIPNIGLGPLHSDLADAIRTFISCEDVSPAKAQLVKEYSQETHLWNGLLLLRGLLAHGILLFAFRERRWRVDYGLAPSRTMLAVPYRAKDVPAQKAEFGQSDVAIILTYLSYYYSGLSEEQLRQCFEILLQQYDPSLDYHVWVRACSTVPESLRSLRGVNVESEEQWDDLIFPVFSRNQATINFFLSRVVFPREAREFPSKLSSSGWDLAEKKERLLTGFSGTNDGQYLLPFYIVQRDLDHQLETNAKILSYLLQPENNHYMCMARQNGERRSALEFLHVLVAQNPEIRVLLDVGAQMLDLQNHELARSWLDGSTNASAAIYFDQDDELMVCTRDGSTQLLKLSPFAQQIDRCVIYIDDAHTRGTDIRFPTGFRAAVTLGPKVTKDRLAQGCMRMRKLGHGHSVMFFAPLEVNQCIRHVAGKDMDPSESEVINTIDILHWAIQETWETIERWTRQWAQQGMEHTSRCAAWSSFCRDQLTSKELLNKWLLPEAKGLGDLYEPRNTQNSALLTSSDFHQRCIDVGVLSLRSVGMDEEQERELIFEVEARHERQTERVPARVSVLPEPHSIHQDVVHFVRTGVIPPGSKSFGRRSEAFIPVFDALDATSAATTEAYIWSQSVLVTKDFEQTVHVSGQKDYYLRPAHWIISAKTNSNDLLVLFSPYEVNTLLPEIRSSKKVHLHLYTPRMIRSMKPCDDLALYSIPAVPKGWIPPSSFMDELGVFAGQLYLKDYETYLRLSRFLCVYASELPRDEEFKVRPDGFILPKNRPNDSQVQIAHTFANTPTVSLRALMDIRGKGIDYSSTHMGKLLHGRLLTRADFED